MDEQWRHYCGAESAGDPSEPSETLLQKNPGHGPSSESTNAKLGVGGGGREGSEKP